MATILIVDDVTANRKFLVTILGHRGHRVLEAADGSEALAAVRAERPDLVISDVLMPVMDGYEFVRQLRAEPATSAIPVVFYTAHYGEREARALALSSGVAHVLTKPASSEAVLKIVSDVLSGELKTPPPDGATRQTEFDREHLRLLTDKLSEKASDLRSANARLRALINIGLELASERDADQLLQSMCVAARDLFGASYVTLGIVDLQRGTVVRFVACGTDTDAWMTAGDAVPAMYGSVLTERRTLRGYNPGGDAGRIQLPALHPEVQAYLVVPIASPAHVYGWIALVGNEGRMFSADDEHLVVALAGQVGRIYELEDEILERERAELAVRHERDRAQRYLDTAEVMLLALDLDGTITLINRKGCDLLGWSDTDLLGKNWIETCLPVRIRSALRKTFSNLVDGDFAITENPVITRLGEERLIEWRNTVLRDDEGGVTGTFSSGTDITERTHAVAALRTAEERMRFALQNAEIGIWDMDYLSGSIRWSETLEAQYGLRPGAFDGTFAAFVAGVHPDDREMMLETIATAAKAGGDFSMLHRSLWTDGTVRWLSNVGRMHIGEHGEAVRGVGISLDVTDRRALEEQYQQAQKMEAIGQLAGGVAHDFNNLLTAILGYCELLLADFDVDDPRQADVVEIQKAGTSAAGLTRQLLAFSRKQIITPTLVDVNAVVTDMRAMLGSLIRENVKVILQFAPTLAHVMADRVQVEQIVMNLALNARDAMPDGGTLTITTANVELDASYAKTHLFVHPGAYVLLKISDSGTGMSPAVQARLFEPFFTTKEPGKGTGLGLATVHGIVTRAGGGITVDSEVGKGTTFTVYFPRADTDGTTDRNDPAAEPLPVDQPVLAFAAAG